MKNGKFLFLGFIITIILASTIYMNNSFGNNGLINNDSLNLSNKAAYIVIDGNTELANNASSGYGNSTHPYIFENYNFMMMANDGIFIQNTDKYFIIRNCTFWEIPTDNMIHLRNVSNALIINNTFSNAYPNINNVGIYMQAPGGGEECNNCNITENLFTLMGTCMYLNDLEDSYIYNNSVVWNYSTSYARSARIGIRIDECYNLKIYINKINGCDYYGLYSVFSTYSTVRDNQFMENYQGIRLDLSISVTCQDNYIFNNSNHGFVLENSQSCDIISNDIINNGQTGIYIFDSSFNDITYNNVWDNLNCIQEVGTCNGNTITDNYCTRPTPPPIIPGFEIFYVLFGLMSLAGLITLIKSRKI